MVQLPLYQPVTNWTPPELQTLPSWRGARRVAVDIETRDPDLKSTGIGVRREGRIIGVSFAIQRETCDDPAKAPAFYLPFGHEGGDNLAREAVLTYLRDQAAGFAGEVVGANLQYDLDYLEEAGVKLRPSFFRDVQIAEPLLDENQFSYSLHSVALRHGFEGKEESLLEQAAVAFGLKNKKGDLWRLPARHVGPYAEVDARLPLQLICKQEDAIREEDRRDPRGASLWSLYDLESRLLPVLLAMRRRGVRIDPDQLDRVEARAHREEEDALAEFSRLSGHRVTVTDINKARVTGPAIEAATGIKLPKCKDGKTPEVQAPFLKSLDHPIVNVLLEAKKYNKLRTTYVGQMRDHAVRGRVHTTFNQLKRETEAGGTGGAVSGRLSAADPSLQNQPVRHPVIGALWRAVYLPDEGAAGWACCDVSQQEPRWAVHFAEQSNCRGARAAADLYRADPTVDNHTAMRDMIGWSGDDGRSRAKTIFLGLSYGMGGAKLCRSLGLPTMWVKARSGRMLEVAGDEGQKILDEFDAKLPFVRELAGKAQAKAEAVGYIRTLLGRRCRFPRPQNGAPGFEWTHKAGNRLIQGTSADQIKKAMVDADAAGLALQLQVHDELDMSVASEEEAWRLADVMRDAVPCNVPMLVVPKVGPHWGDIKKIKRAE